MDFHSASSLKLVGWMGGSVCVCVCVCVCVFFSSNFHAPRFTINKGTNPEQIIEVNLF